MKKIILAPSFFLILLGLTFDSIASELLVGDNGKVKQDMVARIQRNEGFVIYFPLGEIEAKDIISLEQVFSQGDKHKVTILCRRQLGMDSTGAESNNKKE